MELATANAVFQSAMKIPSFVAKSIISCFLFLFACFLFLIIAPNISKPAFAADCSFTPTFLAPGNNLSVTHNGVDTTTLNASIVLNPGAHVVGSLTKNSSTTTQTETLTVPGSTPDGTYTVVMVIAPKTGGSAFFVNCTNPASGNTLSVKLITICGYSFSTAPIAPGSNLAVTISGQPLDGFQGAFFDSGGTAFGTTTGIMPSSGPLTLNIPAPSTQGPYKILVVDKTQSLTCSPSNPTDIIVGSAPTPTPGPNTCTNPGNGQYVLGNSPTISGNTATFSINSGSLQVPIGAGQNVVLHVINNPNTGSPVGTDSPVSGSSVSWTAPGPGNYCAALVFITSQISNAVPFTVGGATPGDTCSSSAIMWVNDVRCRAIAGGWFDSDVFTLGQSAMTFDSLYIMLWGQSTQIPKVNVVTANKGALALSGNMVASLYSAPPASGVQYFAQKIHDLNPVQPAYAAAGGIGYQTLGPVQKIWIAFRNIAYVGFIIVFVIMGFMIMFRAHISPQAVATVQDSIPRLVIALILVTFSYAIAGFMIDIMFLLLNIAIQALVSAKLINDANFAFKQNVFQVIFDNWRAVFGVVADDIKNIIGDVVHLPGIFSWADSVVAWAGGSIAGLVIGIALLFIMFRIFIMLLMAYVMIILLTMFAPFFFLIQALPGNNGAKEWFRQMASNIAVFPTVALMFILAGIMGGITKLGAASTSSVITSGQVGQFPLLVGSLKTDDIGALIGIGFLLVTPSAADIVKNAFGGKSGGSGGMGNIGAAALGAAAAGAGVLGAGGRQAWEKGPIGDYRRYRQSRQQEQIQRRVELESKAKGQRKDTFYK